MDERGRSAGERERASDAGRGNGAERDIPGRNVPERPTVIYDSGCGICRYLLGKVLALDRRGQLAVTPLGGAQADALLSGMPEEDQWISWHLALPDGTLRSGGAAAAPLARLLPAAGPLAPLFERAPRLTERAYRAVARNRSRLGRLVTDGAKRRADARIAAR